MDYICFDRCHQYAAWLLFENTWKNSVKIIQEGSTVRIGSSNEALLRRCQDAVKQFGFGQNGLAKFFSLADPYVGAEQSNNGEVLSRQSLLEEIAGLNSDIWQMRPFLVRNFNPAKTLIQLDKRLHLAFDWSANKGTTTLYVGQTEREVIENLPARNSIVWVAVGRDGILLDGRRPWIAAGNLEHKDHVRELMINAHILGLIHERLYGFYEQIDFTAIRRQATEKVDSDEIGDEALALSLQDLSSEAETAEFSKVRKSPAAQRLRPLRLDKFLNLLEQRFACEVQSGKGDETTVYRPGEKKYRLGKLKQVHPNLLKRVLHRLGIERTDWLRIVYG